MDSPFKPEIKDDAGKWLLAVNLFNIILAVTFSYELATIIWIYFFESIIIGVLTFMKWMTRASSISDKKVGQVMFFFGLFFAFHYGLFHLIYLSFLSSMEIFRIDILSNVMVFVSILSLAFMHVFSFARHASEPIGMEKMKYEEIMEKMKKEEGGKLLQKEFFSPYQRIIPIHITIIAAGFVSFATVSSSLFGSPIPISDDVKLILMVLFMGLKTVADLSAHNRKHKL